MMSHLGQIKSLLSDPVVSNVRVAAQPAEAYPAREGLPPCVSMVTFDGRQTTLRDSSLCDEAHNGKRFYMKAGVIGGPRKSPLRTHPDIVGILQTNGLIHLQTDDPGEAQAAFERGAEYVRTGVLP